MKALTYGSVCSGVEAASLAWRPLGWRCAFVSDIDPFARAVLAHRYPETPLRGDFTEIQRGDHDAIDLLVGGTPCQSFSVAGLRGGLGDDRGNLALEFLRLADRLRPDWLVWENVPGVLSTNGGRDFGAILGGMVELGYGFAYRVLDAQYVRVDGLERAVPQRRRRVFVVGRLGDWRPAAAVLFERESLLGHPPPRREARQGHPRTAALCSGGERESLTDVCTTLVAAGQKLDWAVETFVAEPVAFHPTQDPISSRGVCHALGLGSSGGQASAAVAFQLRGREGGAMAEVDLGGVSPALRAADGGSTRPFVAFSCKDHGADASEGVAPTLRAMGHAGSHANAGGQLAVAYGFAQNQRDELRLMDVSGALASEPGMKQTTYALEPDASRWRVRRLTPRECERLQGMPDDWTLVPWRRGWAPDGPRYKAIGNSMAVNVMRHIGRRIEMVEGLL